MKKNVVAPSVGESITEVTILKWHKKDGQAVKNGEVILEIESEKATVEVIAEADGVLKILKPEGETVSIGATIAEIDPSGKPSSTGASVSSPAPAPAPASAPTSKTTGERPMPGPAARKLGAERGVDLSVVPGTGKDGRVTKGDILGFQGSASAPSPASTPASRPAVPQWKDREGDRRVPMTKLRKTIARRLVEAQHTAAILTTFNEVDMKPVMDLRAKYKDAFKTKHGVPLSFMSFFGRACVEALKELQAVNAMIDGEDLIYRDYVDLGIAVGTDRGLVVPVIRGAEKMGFVDLEKSLGVLAEKARTGKLSIADMTGGTFTISNGGTYGSLLSTPILNPPQSGILGMHKIQERPVVINGQIVVRPMMYVALSYDHRIIDGKEAVTFLVTMKNLLENPEKLGLDFTHGL